MISEIFILKIIKSALQVVFICFPIQLVYVLISGNKKNYKIKNRLLWFRKCFAMYSSGSITSCEG